MDLKCIRAYIYELFISAKIYWTDHVQKLELTQNKMYGKGPRCNIEKSLSRKTKMEYLRFRVKRDGIKPVNKNIEIITNMKPPTPQK